VALIGLSPLQFFVAFILPHGLFEITAAVLTGAAILRLGGTILAPPANRTLGDSFLIALADWAKVAVALVIPLLVVAAAMEVFVTPLVVLMSAAFVGMGIGHAKFMDLIFSPMEVVAIVLTVGIVVILGINGESNWFEGTLLLGLYAILAIAFFYIPAEAHEAVQSTMPAAAP